MKSLSIHRIFVKKFWQKSKLVSKPCVALDLFLTAKNSMFKKNFEKSKNFVMTWIQNKVFPNFKLKFWIFVLAAATFVPAAATFYLPQILLSRNFYFYTATCYFVSTSATFATAAATFVFKQELFTRSYYFCTVICHFCSSSCYFVPLSPTFVVAAATL